MSSVLTSSIVTEKSQIVVEHSPYKQKKNPPAIDANGKVIPRSSRWGYSTPAFDNGQIKSTLFLFFVTNTFVLFNQTNTARTLYSYIDTHYTPFQINCWGTFMITTLLYWIIALLFAFADFTGFPGSLFKYKVQPFQRVSRREYLEIAAIVLRNQFFVVLPLLFLKGKIDPAPVDPSQLSGAWTTMLSLGFNVLCAEVGFYFIHRTFHSPWLYQRFHKQHHRMTAPVALSATYCTMTEHISNNLLPNAIGTTILRSHWSVSVYTFCMLEISTLCAHSGYNIPFLFSSLHHDWHHFAFNENFGAMGLLDSIFGTASRYESALQDGIRRHAGQRDKAREELLSKLAAWELE